MTRVPGNQRRRLAFVWPLVVFVGLSTGWFKLIEWNWNRIETLCGPSPRVPPSERDWKTIDSYNWKKCDPILMGSDAIEYSYYFRNFPRSFTEIPDITQDQIIVEPVKRPLYGPISATLTFLASAVLRLSYPAAMYVTLSLYAAACSFLLYLTLRECGSSRTLASMFTAMATLSGAWVSVFSVPESYSLTVLALLLTLWSGTTLRTRASNSWAPAARHVAITAIATCVYPPLGGALLFLAGIRPFHRRLRIVAAVLLFPLLVLIPQLLIGGNAEIEELFRYVLAFGSVNNLASARSWLETGAAFSAFSVVFPGSDPLQSAGHIDWAFVVEHVSLIVGASLATVLLITFCWAGLKMRESTVPVVAPLIWMCGLLVFHVFFNPGEILLYVAVPFTLVCYLCAVVANGTTRLQPASIGFMLAPVLAVEIIEWSLFLTRA